MTQRRSNRVGTDGHIATDRHPIHDAGFVKTCRAELDRAGALVLDEFFTPEAVSRVIAESEARVDEVLYADSSHNVYLTPFDPELPDDHPANRQIRSTKGLIADDQIPADSPLRDVYDDAAFRQFLCDVLGIASIYPYADELSSINVHFAPDGRELGWHFDNSSFAVTMLLQAPSGGGRFEYVPAVRDAAGRRRSTELAQSSMAMSPCARWPSTPARSCSSGAAMHYIA